MSFASRPLTADTVFVRFAVTVKASSTAIGAPAGMTVRVTVAVLAPSALRSVYVNVSVGGLTKSVGGVYVNAPDAARLTLPPSVVVAA